MTIQTEDPPYKYASIEGPVTIGPPTHDRSSWPAATSAPELGQWYVGQRADEGTVDVRLRPEHWRTHDFAKAL